MMRALPSVTIPQLQYLVAVADAPTWAVAAAELGVTPSALSQGLAELERRLGFHLFERNGRSRVVAGRSLPVLVYARTVLAQTGDLTRWIEATTSGQTGILRVGMIDAAAIDHYSAVLQAFRQNHPDASFTLNVAPSGELLEQLEADRLDLVVVVRPPIQPARVEWVELLDEPLAVYAPAGTLVGEPSTWGPWVLFPATSHTRRLTTSALHELGARTDVVAESNQPEVLREMVRLGMGWTVLPVIQAEAGPQPLQRISATPLLQRTLVAARRRGSVTNALAGQLVKELRSAADPD